MVFWNKNADQSFGKLPKGSWQGPRFLASKSSQQSLQRHPSQSQHDTSRPDSKRSYQERPPSTATPEWSAPSSYQPTRASSISSRKSSKANSIVSNDRSESFAQSFMRHGRKLRRQGSKIFSGSATTSGEPSRSSSAMGSVVGASSGFSSGLSSGLTSGRTSGRSTPHTGGAIPRQIAPNPVISGPSNFQHLTHTGTKEFGNISRTSQNDLIAEFAAVRAGQGSRTDLRGIKTEELHSRSSSCDTSYTLHSSAVPSLVDSAGSRDSLLSSGLSSPASRQSIRSIRSKESFSLPFYNGRPPRLREPPTAPPRTSSRRAPTRNLRQAAISNYVNSGNSSPINRDSGFYEPRRYSDEKSPGGEPYWDEMSESVNQAHAISTSDDYVCESPNWYSQTFESGLPSVYEEETASMHTQTDAMETSQHGQRVSYDVTRRASSISLGSGHSSVTVTAAPHQRDDNDDELEPIDELGPSNEFRSQTSQSQQSRFSMNRTSAVNGLFSSWHWDDDGSDEDSTEPPYAANASSWSRPPGSEPYSDQYLVCQDPWMYRTTDPIYEEDEESMADPDFFSTSQVATPKAPSTPKRNSLDTASHRLSWKRISGAGNLSTKQSVREATIDEHSQSPEELDPRYRLSRDVQADLDELQKCLAKLEQETASQMLQETKHVHVQRKPSRIPLSSTRVHAAKTTSTAAKTTPPPKKRKIVAFADLPSVREIHTPPSPGTSRIPVPRNDSTTSSPSTPPRKTPQSPTNGAFSLSLFPSPPAVNS